MASGEERGEGLNYLASTRYQAVCELPRAFPSSSQPPEELSTLTSTLQTREKGKSDQVRDFKDPAGKARLAPEVKRKKTVPVHADPYLVFARPPNACLRLAINIC